MYVCMYVRVYVCMYVCVCVCMYAHHKLVYVVVDVIDLCQVVLVLELSNLLLNHQGIPLWICVHSTHNL